LTRWEASEERKRPLKSRRTTKKDHLEQRAL
jgi:hypothetical protein